MIDFDAWWVDELNRQDRPIDDWDYEDEHECAHPTAYARLWSGRFKFCGCGTEEPSRVMARVLWALYESHKARGTDYRLIERSNSPATIYGMPEWFEPIVSLCLHILDAHELTEHGSSVGGSWLSEAGATAAAEVFEAAEGGPDA